MLGDFTNIDHFFGWILLKYVDPFFLCEILRCNGRFAETQEMWQSQRLELAELLRENFAPRWVFVGVVGGVRTAGRKRGLLVTIDYLYQYLMAFYSYLSKNTTVVYLIANI